MLKLWHYISGFTSINISHSQLTSEAGRFCYSGHGEHRGVSSSQWDLDDALDARGWLCQPGGR